jgi:hypothetical protein
MCPVEESDAIRWPRWGRCGACASWRRPAGEACRELSTRSRRQGRRRGVTCSRPRRRIALLTGRTATDRRARAQEHSHRRRRRPGHSPSRRGLDERTAGDRRAAAQGRGSMTAVVVGARAPAAGRAARARRGGSGAGRDVAIVTSDATAGVDISAWRRRATGRASGGRRRSAAATDRRSGARGDGQLRARTCRRRRQRPALTADAVSRARTDGP